MTLRYSITRLCINLSVIKRLVGTQQERKAIVLNCRRFDIY